MNIMTINREGVIVLTIMSILNILDYFHRYIPSALKDLIKEDLHLSDLQTGIVYTSFIICYMIVCPLIGIITKRWNLNGKYINRRNIIIIGIIMWSIATSMTGLCKSFYTILIPRIIFGFGEAIYGTLGPAMLSDFFIPSQRSVIMAIFYAATPVGCALGYAITGVLGQHIGWRMTCVYLGIPGILALSLLFIREPTIGEKDVPEETQPLIINSQEPQNITNDSLLNGTYIFTVAGFVAVTFGMGGFSDWLPTFFSRYHGMSIQMAGLVNGGIVVVGGLFGALIGGYVNELIIKYVTKRHPYFLISGIAMEISAILSIMALYCFQNTLFAVLLLFGFAVFFGWLYNGPINAIIQNCVPANLRPHANGMSVLFIHLFGDSISPAIIGAISDNTNENLRVALILVPVSFVVASLLWLMGWFIAPVPTRRIEIVV